MEHFSKSGVKTAAVSRRYRQARLLP